VGREEWIVTPRPVALRGVVLVAALAVAGWNVGHAGWIAAKARLAHHLVRRAWDRERAGAGDVRPWPWADTHPVARLRVPERDVDLMVLAGASGRTMAFGPGHMSGTPLPGEPGNAVVAGHRDTHFAFLRRLRVGDVIVIERRDGGRWRYVVSRALIVDHRETWVAEDGGGTRLTLVTCYPFDAIQAGGPLRYVVSAELDEGPRTDSWHRPRPRRSGLPGDTEELPASQDAAATGDPGLRDPPPRGALGQRETGMRSPGGATKLQLGRHHHVPFVHPHVMDHLPGLSPDDACPVRHECALGKPFAAADELMVPNSGSHAGV
jgi:sortase A